MIITADWILPMAQAPIRDGFVAVEHGIIAAIGPLDQLSPAQRADQRLDLKGTAVLPGLINLHTHLEYSAVTGLPDGPLFFDWIVGLIRRVESWKREDWLVSARGGAEELLQSGVTCVADMSYSGHAVQALKEVGMRGLVGRELFCWQDADAEMRLRMLQERVHEMRGRSSPLTRVGIALHAPYTVVPSAWRAAAAWAQETRLPILCHLAESPAESSAIATGEGEIGAYLRFQGQEHLPWVPRGQSPVAHVAAFGGLVPGMLAAHCVQVDDRDLQQLKEAGVAIAHCPRSNARLGCGRAPLERISGAGIHWGLGTDSAASGSPLNLWEEMRFALGLHRAMRPDWSLTAGLLLQQVTLGAARALGWDGELGSLEAGKAADLIAVPVAGGGGRGAEAGGDGGAAHDICSQIVYTAQRASLVMVAGEVVFRTG